MATTRHNLLRDTLKAAIEDRTFQPGERLPSIVTLCREYGVSNTTVRAVLKELSHEGWIESRPGSGYYVRPEAGQTPDAPRLTGANTIAVVVAASGNTFYGEIIRGAEEVCRERGYRLVVAYSNEDVDLEARQITELAYQVAGLLIIPVARNARYSGYATLLEKNVPFVFVDCFVDTLAAPLVSTDNEQGGYLAASHLIQTGRRELYVISERLVSSLEDRIAGFRRALREAGVPWEPSLVRKSGRRNDEAGYLLTRELLAQRAGRADRPPIGLFAVNVAVAHGCYVAIREAGLEIPRDVAVVGFDEDYSPFLDPPLSTVRQDPRRMGATAAETLFPLLMPGTRAAQRKQRSVLLPPELVIRGSSDPASTYSPDADLLRRVQVLVGPAGKLGEAAAADAARGPIGN